MLVDISNRKRDLFKNKLNAHIIKIEPCSEQRREALLDVNQINGINESNREFDEEAHGDSKAGQSGVHFRLDSLAGCVPRDREGKTTQT